MSFSESVQKLLLFAQIVFFGFCIFLGLYLLASGVRPEKSPEVIPSESQYECSFDKRTGEYYCPDGPEIWQDEFPARP
jgi:hypothetical protein